MDANIKRQLDLRLAKGEISKEEYLSTLQTLTQHTADESFSLSSLFSKAKAALFDEFQMVVPTDDAPLMVNDELCLFSSHLTYKGRQMLYSEIISLGYKAKKEFTNGTLTAYDSTLWILPTAGGYISTSASLSFMGIGKIAQRKVKLAENAYVFLRHITFQQRLRWNLNELETKGYIGLRFDLSEPGSFSGSLLLAGLAYIGLIDLSGPGQGVKLYRDGYIQKGDVRINLREAHQKKMIQFGSSGLLRQNPNRVVFGDTGIGGELWIDHDVIKSIILWLAEGKAI